VSKERTKELTVLNVFKEWVAPDILVVRLAGRLTLGRNSQELEWHMEELLSQNQKKVVFDLSRLTYIDSAGIGIVTVCSGRLKESGGQLRVACAKGAVQQLLKLTGADRVLLLHATLQSALEAFQSASQPGAQPSATPSD